ncbi:hypothetical protein MRX96_007909 [Rhipicephalus microplus]
MKFLVVILASTGLLDAVPKYCSFRRHPGYCQMGVKSFYWDKRSSKCRQFHYNGRFGNSNPIRNATGVHRRLRCP